MELAGIVEAVSGSIADKGFVLIVFVLLLVLWNWMNRQTKDLVKILDTMKKDIEINEQRLWIHDRVSSSFTDEEFDSKAVAKGDQRTPSTKTIRRFLARENGRS